MDEEARDYQELSASVKFKQNLVQGLGAATVFGMVAAGGTALFKLAGTAFTSAVSTGGVGAGLIAATPWILGITAIVGVGIGCLYFASKFYAESVRIDQIHQARQITNGMRSPGIEQQKPIPFPAQEAGVATTMLDKPAAAPIPLNTINDRTLLDRVANPSKDMVVA